MLTSVMEWAENLFRWFYWTVIKVESSLINTLLVALEKGVLQAGITDNSWVQSAVTASITLMFIILPVKLIYEIVFSMIRDEDNIDVSKKMFGALTAVMIAVSITTLVSLTNDLTIGSTYNKGVMTMLLNGDTNTSDNSYNSSSTTSKNLLVSVFSSFGGMDETVTTFKDKDSNGNGVDIGAKGLVELMLDDDNTKFKKLSKDPGYNKLVGDSKKNDVATFDSKSFNEVRYNLYYRWDDVDNDSGDDADLWTDSNLSSTIQKAREKYIHEHDNQYVWDFNYLMVIIGLAIFVILLFIITIEIATRLIQIAFFMIIGPLCCMSLTNYQNPQAFTIWKNSIVGAYFVNFAQIFMLIFLCNIAGTISSISIQSNVMAQGIAKIALYIGAFTACLSMPTYIQSMIGGYGAGMIESMQQLKGAIGGAWGMTGGAVLGTTKKAVGRHNDMTGHLTGGVRGKIMGNKNTTGDRIGGIPGAVEGAKNMSNKLFGGSTGGTNAAGVNDHESDNNSRVDGMGMDENIKSTSDNTSANTRVNGVNKTSNNNSTKGNQSTSSSSNSIKPNNVNPRHESSINDRNKDSLDYFMGKGDYSDRFKK